MTIASLMKCIDRAIQFLIYLQYYHRQRLWKMKYNVMLALYNRSWCNILDNANLNALQKLKNCVPFLPSVCGQWVQWRSNSSRSRARSCNTSRYPGIRAVFQEIQSCIINPVQEIYMTLIDLPCSRNTTIDPVQEIYACTI